MYDYGFLPLVWISTKICTSKYKIRPNKHNINCNIVILLSNILLSNMLGSGL